FASCRSSASEASNSRSLTLDNCTAATMARFGFCATSCVMVHGSLSAKPGDVIRPWHYPATIQPRPISPRRQLNWGKFGRQSYTLLGVKSHLVAVVLQHHRNLP